MAQAAAITPAIEVAVEGMALPPLAVDSADVFPAATEAAVATTEAPAVVAAAVVFVKSPSSLVIMAIRIEAILTETLSTRSIRPSPCLSWSTTSGSAIRQRLSLSNRVCRVVPRVPIEVVHALTAARKLRTEEGSTLADEGDANADLGDKLVTLALAVAPVPASVATVAILSIVDGTTPSLTDILFSA
jgi:hypothetical protein